ncbi:hypothetical protein BDP27DRAFT_1344903 [Rhodocollybia butyracea]|uniref:Uncharacterized protein n=1 Tax=Rhodocollybia butyracea TaxID=206335 RepID=A0A9P5P9J8_9AGAR|nr:hypothetical protein BDP27DRAFT_1344903 [Rhodocollybia butyracea]
MRVRLVGLSSLNKPALLRNKLSAVNSTMSTESTSALLLPLSQRTSRAFALQGITTIENSPSLFVFPFSQFWS